MVRFDALEQYIKDHYMEEREDNFRAAEKCDAPYMNDLGSARNYTTRPLYSGFPMRKLSDNTMGRQRSLEDVVDHLDETFSQMLLRLIDQRGFKDSYVYRKANVDRRLFSKIRNNVDYAPTKKTVLSFAIALELTLDETIDLLTRAGYALSHSSKFDVIIQFFLENHIYDVFEINEVLFKYNQPILGE